MVHILFLALGIAMLFSGGDVLVRGASGVARALRVPTLIIGLTLVAFGTSAPELVVNLIAVIQGNPHVAFGNVMGSNMANIGLILGLAALSRPIDVDATSIVREIPMMILVSGAAVIMGIDRMLTGRPDAFDRTDGLILLMFFAVFLYYNTYDAIRASRKDSYLARIEESMTVARAESLSRNMFLSVAGIVLLVAGGKLTVSGAVGAARMLGVSEGLIGLTIVAIGTSLPELAASMAAAIKKESELALGNVVGSNIFNLSLILGLSSTISPVDIPRGGGWDLAAMAALALVLLPMGISSMKRITRAEGAFLLAGYCIYMTLRAVFLG